MIFEILIEILIRILIQILFQILIQILIQIQICYWSVVQLSLEEVLSLPWFGHNWPHLQETVIYITMWFHIILFPAEKKPDICKNILMDIYRWGTRLQYWTFLFRLITIIVPMLQSQLDCILYTCKDCTVYSGWTSFQGWN